MVESGLPADDVLAARLFRASELSLDPSTASFSLRRVVPISIFIEGDSEQIDEMGRIFSQEVRRALEDAGYDEALELGPFAGSKFTMFFAKGRRPEDGDSFKRWLEQLGVRFAAFGKTIPKEVFAGLKVVMIVGTKVIGVVGPAAVAMTLPFTIPIAVIEYIMLAGEAAEIALAIHELIDAHRRSKGIFHFS
jgi:hypothetical protein